MTKKVLALSAFALFLVIAGGLLWLAVQNDNAASALLSYTAGLSMIFLPCTLPLALIIVPLALQKKNAGKSLGLAVAFGLGLSVTLALYGIATAFLGDYFGLDQFTRVMFVVAGAMALLFALSELNLLRVPMPEFTSRVPAWITQGYGKSFLLGLFLGNAGVGCPNPAFYVLLTYIASTGSTVVGGWLGLVHGLGRATPLIFLVLLALLGVKNTNWLSRTSLKVRKWSGAGLVLAGAFILTYGLFGMHWWEDSVFHAGWNQFIMNIAPSLAEAPDHPVAEGVWEAPHWAGWLSFTLGIFIPMFWYKLRHGMKRVTFWVVTVILVLLALGAATDITAVEHGHGPAHDDEHGSAHDDGHDHGPETGETF